MSKNTPKVGILMPAYNQGPYIHDALESLEEQSFQDYEVLVVDDGSTDGVTPEILKSLKVNKGNVIVPTENIGINGIVGKYMPMLKNEYVMVFCADDKIKPTFLEETVRYLDEHKDAGAVCPWLEYFGAQSGVLKYDPKKAQLPNILVEDNLFLGSALARREAMKAIGWSNKDDVFRVRNDHDRWVSILERGYSLGVIKKPLFCYRILKNSLSRRSLDTEILSSYIQASIRKHPKLYQENLEFVITELQKSRLEAMNDWQELHNGHEWLDTEYKKQVETVHERDAKIHKLNQEITQLKSERDALHLQNEKLKKFSLYPALKKLRDSVKK